MIVQFSSFLSLFLKNLIIITCYFQAIRREAQTVNTCDYNNTPPCSTSLPSQVDHHHSLLIDNFLPGCETTTLLMFVSKYRCQIFIWFLLWPGTMRKVKQNELVMGSCIINCFLNSMLYFKFIKENVTLGERGWKILWKEKYWPNQHLLTTV